MFMGGIIPIFRQEIHLPKVDVPFSIIIMLVFGVVVFSRRLVVQNPTCVLHKAAHNEKNLGIMELVVEISTLLEVPLRTCLHTVDRRLIRFPL